jgi:hypothetical protein
MKTKKSLTKATFLLIILISGSISCEKEEYCETCTDKNGYTEKVCAGSETGLDIKERLSGYYDADCY